MLSKTQVVKFLSALAVTIASVWTAMISPALGLFIVSSCLAAVAYLQLVLPHQAEFFFEHQTTRDERRKVAAGLILATAALGMGMGGAVWLAFPRDMTALEYLEPRYIRCRALVRRPVESAEEFVTYRRDGQEWLIATREWIRLNLEPIALERFIDTSGILPISMPDEFNKEHRDLRNAITRYCDNLKEVMDNYAE